MTSTPQTSIRSITLPANPKILVIKMSSLGDVIHALPSLYALRALYPQGIIHWAVEEAQAPLLPGPPYIDRIYYFPKKNLKTLSPCKIWRTLKKFRSELAVNNYDLVIDLQGLAKSALVALLSGGKVKLGYWEMREGSFLISKGIKGEHALSHVIERYLDVIRFLGPVPDEIVYPLPDYTPQKIRLEEKLKALGCQRGRLIAFFPGASWPTKLWPPEYYAQLAQKLTGDGWEIVLGGGHGERNLADTIKSLSPAVKYGDLVGQTDLRDLMALADLAKAVVGSDSGPLHLAAAVGVPTVTLFGPNSSQRTGTYGPNVTNLMSPAPCAPCFKKTCPKEFICLKQISPQKVYEAVKTAILK
jgi:heptosyltransferase-1/heptosyltransferase-2